MEGGRAEISFLWQLKVGSMVIVLSGLRMMCSVIKSRSSRGRVRRSDVGGLGLLAWFEEAEDRLIVSILDSLSLRRIFEVVVG